MKVSGAATVINNVNGEGNASNIILTNEPIHVTGALSGVLSVGLFLFSLNDSYKVAEGDRSFYKDQGTCSFRENSDRNLRRLPNAGEKCF